MPKLSTTPSPNPTTASSSDKISSPPPPPRNTARTQHGIISATMRVIISAILAFGAFFWQWSSLSTPTTTPTTSTLSSCPRHPTNNLNDREIDLSSFSLESHNENIPFECFFSSNFFEAKALFQQSGAKAGAQMYRLPIIEGDDAICSDLAVIPGHPHKFLLHISGTHGPEGFSGSASQSAALQYLNSKAFIRTENTPTILFVHALNAYGFANNRRVNEDNVDLNRNFLSDEEFKFVHERDPNFAGYVDIDSALNPTSKPFQSLFLNEIYGYLQLVVAYFKHGMLKMKRGLVSGNYHKQTGLGFGGFKLSKSAINLRSVVQHFQIDDLAEKVVLIDVHTGLGPSGVDTLMVDLNEYNDDEITFFRSLFPADVNSTNNATIGGILENFKGVNDANSASAGYDLTIGTVSETFCEGWLAPQLPKGSKYCLTQEFGTYSPLIVGKNLVDENYAFHHGSQEEKEIYGQRLRGSFYVETREWKRNVLRRGLALFLQGVHALEVM